MIDMNAPASLRAFVDRRLMDGENLIRLEQPDPRLYKRKAMRQCRMFGFIFAGFASFGLVWALTHDATAHARSPHIREFVAGAFLLGAALLLLSPWIFRSAARGWVYAVTDRRVLSVFCDWFGNITFRSIEPQSLEPRTSPCADGTPAGDIDLIGSRRFDSEAEEKDFYAWSALRDVRGTEAALRRLAQSSSKSSL